MAKNRAKAIANIIVALVLLVNAVLTAMGKNPLPFDENQAAEMASYALSVLSTIYVWWKNNNITVEAETAQEILNEMKMENKVPQGTGDPEEGAK